MNNEERDIINKTKGLIDELKSISENNGIGNSPSEYKIITEVFLYKFLNDKFLYEIKRVDENLAKLNKPKEVEQALINMKDDYNVLLLKLNASTANLKIEHLISYLFSHKNDLYVQSGDIGLIIPNEEVLDKNFAYYLISSPMIKKQLGVMAQQTKIIHTSPEKIKSCEAIIPKIETQKKIGRLLRYIDEEIEYNNSMNEQSEKIAKMIYDYWFLQFEFPNEEGRPYKSSGGIMVWNEELKREIPKGWNIGKLGELFESQCGYAFNSNEWKTEGIPVLTIKCILENGSIDINGPSYIDKKYFSKKNKYSVLNGNMIFAMSGNTIGKIGIVASREENILINQRVLILKTNVNNIAYTYFNIKNQDMQNKILQLGSNSVQPNISEQGFKEIKVCIPASNILNKYNKICSVFFDDIICNRVENEELTKLRDYLLPLLMNGQVSFKEMNK